MRKLPAFVLAAATVLTVAGVPMTAQAATCSRSLPNSYSSNCYGQSLNSLLSQYGCNSKNRSNCSNSGQKGATYNSRSNCNFGQFSSYFRNCR
ncbi:MULTISPECIES: hypothetical protein [Lacrimispora]|uniref:hypothetical protein n=1 Tax=Lacrimispora TaxID=2719231 RepID=UPI000BE44F6A|nr:hypothetical protein [Lacrimispora amygdalina]MDK2967982.1 hypothetical protein [Lacrimispora sp.]